ncbi:unnamed protein product [Litomosoides sigmodontis]|uniref:Uncharacterized protein n=1 Tax=Litomosoides sigmodontis TaxID=42156 RepID=A0A3P6T6G4_LITSI|nr:unnamed protein product [Litomosoides sigmodontis]
MRKLILLFARQVAICQKQCLSTTMLQFLLGILIGSILGYFAAFKFDGENFTRIRKSSSIATKQWKQSINLNPSTILSNIQIQCIIFIHPNQLTKRKYVQSLRDTYTKQCNHTIYVTNSKKIVRYFAEELHVAFVNTRKTSYHWELYREIIKYSTEYGKQQQSFWTVISDEQTFIVMANLRRLLHALSDVKRPVILGRVSNKRNLLSYLFPWNSHSGILPQAGIVFSRSALEEMTSDKCVGWLSARATERALIRCSNLVNVQIVDPTDKEGKHLFVPNGFENLVAGNELKFSTNVNERFFSHSDEAVSFGNLNYHDHQVLDFATTRIKVFG